jgi:hypothetical protein
VYSPRRVATTLSAFTEMHDRVAMGIALLNWSQLAWAQGQLEQFVRVLAAASGRRPMRATDRRRHPYAPILDQRLEAARASLWSALGNSRGIYAFHVG